MERTFLYRGYSHLLRVPSGIRSLSSSLHPKVRVRAGISVLFSYRKLILGFLLLVAAGLLGVYAHEEAYSEALLTWQKTHHPSLETWKGSLLTRGFEKIENASILGKIAHRLPATFDGAASTWTAPDFKWIVVFPEEEAKNPVTVFRFQGYELLPENWEPQGASWVDFDRVVGEIDKRRAAWDSLPKKKPKEVYRDPRAIEY